MIWASRFASLASGYPLHQPLQPFGLSWLVPLLSLSQRLRRTMVRLGAPALRAP
jgi:hypothetical protein